MVNRTILQGRLVNSPEMRRTNNGTAVCSFRVAWSETIKDRETKLFLNCVAWQGTAELICKYWYKGKEILWRASCPPANTRTRTAMTAA